MAQGKFTKSPTPGNIVSAVNAMVDDIAGKAASSHNHSASNITSGTLAVARGGTGVTANPSMLTNLGSTSAASVFAASPRPGVTGTLPIANGGTGATTASQACANLGALPLSGGTMTGAIKRSGNVIENIETISSTNICGGTSLDNGACLVLRGKDQTGINGRFELSAKNDENSTYLTGLPTGDLVFGGNNPQNIIKVEQADSAGLNYAAIYANSEGGNLRLQKSNGVGLEIDTAIMNGTNGYVRMYFNKPNVEAWMGFSFYETGDIVDGRGNNLSQRGLVDWNRGQGLSIGALYTASCDGFIHITIQRQSNMEGHADVYINGGMKFQMFSNNYSIDSIFIPVQKGETFQVTIAEIQRAYLDFWPMKGTV